MSARRRMPEAQSLALRRRLLATEAAMQRMRISSKMSALRGGTGALGLGLRLWGERREQPAATVLPVIGALALWRPAWRDRLTAALLLWRLGGWLRDHPRR